MLHDTTRRENGRSPTLFRLSFRSVPFARPFEHRCVITFASLESGVSLVAVSLASWELCACKSGRPVSTNMLVACKFAGFCDRAGVGHHFSDWQSQF